nr:MAG TPA: hypothetical protein [Bacteriophage sp.]
MRPRVFYYLKCIYGLSYSYYMFRRVYRLDNGIQHIGLCNFHLSKIAF